MTEEKKYTGVINISTRGVGYVSTEDSEEDLEIQPEFLNTALHGDQVEVLAKGRGPSMNGRPPRLQGAVVTVTERAKTSFVGTLTRSESRWFLVPDDRRVYVDIAIAPEDTEGLKPGYKALVEIEPWQNPKENPRGRIKELLGEKGENTVEMHAIVLEHGFATLFPPEVLAEAEALKVNHAIATEEIVRRRDCRSLTTFTIDPADAKDFDDALSVRELEGGLVEVGVHIADPSFYVKPGSAIDREARKRATSVYLVDRTIPMLPEVLSNDICSLNANEDKLTLSAIFTLDPDGEVRERWFGETVIHSNKRFTYEEAQGVLDAKEGPFLKELTLLDALAGKLRAKRVKDGAISFEQDEVKFKLDERGKPIAIYKKARIDTNFLIEDFMLLANREVAQFVHQNAKAMGFREGGFIYRVHDAPKEDRLADLELFLRAIGYELKRESGSLSPKDLNTLFKEIEGTPEENLIKVATIRSMAKAVYTTKNIGHFGMAFKYYTHFTSPIRRYPDMMVHRILRYHLAHKRIPDQELEGYERLAVHSSEREVEASEAERESIKYKQAEFMQERIGEKFDGIVSGVAEWGLYVEEKNTKAEGLVRIRNLGNDFFVLDKKNYRIVGEKTKKIFSLGDTVRVKLAAADPETRTIDWELV